MQNGGFVNKIQGVRLSVAKIHRHVFENPGCIFSLLAALLVSAAFVATTKKGADVKKAKKPKRVITKKGW